MSNRDKYLTKNENPAPGQYNIKRNLIKKKLFPHKGVMSAFSQPTEKKKTKNEELVKYLDDDQKKFLGHNIKPIPEESYSPGPGEYE